MSFPRHTDGVKLLGTQRSGVQKVHLMERSGDLSHLALYQLWLACFGNFLCTCHYLVSILSQCHSCDSPSVSVESLRGSGQ